jgi:sec-independent protein translocase protein TatA
MTLLSIFFGFMGGYEWVLILLAVLLLFGGKKIPELMRGIGSGIKEFKDATNDDNEAIDRKKD